ncbi:hypothetical protein L1277_002714 [Okibacterium sp. HSC-33S16]|uniref:DUF6236 family protein n=1 Tax=Okibacterium sp. HSC-33S16 TaxID=2910965 RepID=UPI00209E71FF|nr:DUF6236 family protein [Okibacterium sp. HSC-33S16]MCP2032604.1 hypothetical protein [Okibacterium sp. HSC-33S16]
MEQTALYFPYIRVPESPWFTQVLLYWDSVASIVPRSFQRAGEAEHPYMQQLRKEGMLEYLSPDDAMREIDRDSFDEGFLGLLSAPAGPPSSWRFVRLHSGKMSWSLFERLSKKGLARTDDGLEFGWWQIESETADTYMAYLAAAMSGARKGLLPVTDQRRAIGILAPGIDDVDRRLAELRFAVIMDALPAPSSPVPAAELRAFKEDNHEELQRCRVFLDAKLVDLALIDNATQREVKAKGVMQEIERDLAKLREQMQKKRWPKVVLVGFGGVTGIALATAATIVSGGAALSVGLSVGAGVLEAGAVGYGVAELLKQRAYDPLEPLAYAALASQL